MLVFQAGAEISAVPAYTPIGLDASNDDNAPVLPLHWLPGPAEKVVQLAAKDEYRLNFALNPVQPDHTELQLRHS